MTTLSPHFTLDEMTRSATAIANGVNNAPDALAIEHLTRTAAGLEAVRTLLGEPLAISSGYRSPDVNRAVGGSRTSAHCFGYAADFTCAAAGTPYQVCLAILRSDIAFDQLIHEYGRWTHISFDPRMRRQPLTIANAKRGYLAGILEITTP